MEKTRLIIFDLDGTLFRTETVDIEAFNKTLALNGYQIKQSHEILNLMGLVLADILKILLATNDLEVIEKFKSQLIKIEDEEIIEHGQLYEGTYEFLVNLKKKGFTLCICSNGNEEYVKSIAKKFNFYELFSDIWYEKKGISKDQAVKILKDKYNVDSFIMVGDRLCDIEAAKNNGGISIGAAYGFGGDEPDEAHYKAQSIGELEKIILDIYPIAAATNIQN